MSSRLLQGVVSGCFLAAMLLSGIPAVSLESRSTDPYATDDDDMTGQAQPPAAPAAAPAAAPGAGPAADTATAPEPAPAAEPAVEPAVEPEAAPAPAGEKAVEPPAGDAVDEGESDEPSTRGHGERDESPVERETRRIKAFEGASLMVGPNVKVPTQSRRFAVGIDLDVAPLNVVANKTRDAIVDEAVNQICSASPDQESCKTMVEGNVDQVLATLDDVTPDQWETLRSAAGGDPAALDGILQDIGVSDPDAREQVVGFVNDYAGDAGTAEQRMQAVDAVRTVSTSSAISLLFEPYLYVNFKWIELTLTTPFAVQIMDSGNEVEMANIGLNLKSGGNWDVGSAVSFGLTGGVEFFLPSGTSGIDRSLNSDIFSAPKFTYGYLTWAPYLVLGMDVARIFQLQTHFGLVSMHDVLDVAGADNVMYMRYGAGFILMPKFVVGLLFELNGCKGIRDAGRFDALMVATGLNFRMAFFKMFLGVQIPLMDQGRFVWDSNYWTSANYDQLSKFTVMSRIGFEF